MTSPPRVLRHSFADPEHITGSSFQDLLEAPNDQGELPITPVIAVTAAAGGNADPVATSPY